MILILGKIFINAFNIPNYFLAIKSTFPIRIMCLIYVITQWTLCNSKFYFQYLGELKNGFFLEAGAHDGEFNSDSLYFEAKHNWTGLLGKQQI